MNREHEDAQLGNSPLNGGNLGKLTKGGSIYFLKKACKKAYIPGVANRECTSSERVVWKKLSGLLIYKPGVVNERHIQKLNEMHNIMAHMHRNHFHAIACRKMLHFIEHLQPTRCRA